MRFQLPRFLLLALCVAMLPRYASAIHKYEGNVVGDCITYNNVTYNVKASVEDPLNWPVDSLQYVFTPTPAQSTSIDTPNRKIRYFSVSPGTYRVAVRNPNPQGTYSIEAPDCSPPPKGLTWRFVKKNSPSGTIRVGCGQNECDARKGDTPCTKALPILCIKKAGGGFPLPVPATVDNTNRYNKWSGGVVGTTSATKPPKTLAGANALCARQFGPGWRVAEHHDGWGWYFQAYGGVGDRSSRFWVHINDQPGALCWK